MSDPREQPEPKGEPGLPVVNPASVPRGDPAAMLKAALRYAAQLDPQRPGDDMLQDIEEVSATIACPACNGTVESRWEMQQFAYGEGIEAAELSARVPVRTCIDCGFEFLDEHAERARHEAVCQHLNRLTPAEIRIGRKELGLNRREFASLTAIGEASLGRWESGAQIQTAAMDRLMRMAFIPENAERLRALAFGVGEPTRRIVRAIPRVLLDSEARRELGRTFQLHGTTQRRSRAA